MRWIPFIGLFLRPIRTIHKLQEMQREIVMHMRLMESLVKDYPKKIVRPIGEEVPFIISPIDILVHPLRAFILFFKIGRRNWNKVIVRELEERGELNTCLEGGQASYVST